MSNDMLKVVGAADPSQIPRIPPAKSVRASQASDERQPLAGPGDILPPNDPADVEQAVNQVNQFVQNLSRDLQFTVDEYSGRTVIKVLDSETKEVIRQIPPEEMLRIASHLSADGSLLLKVRA